MNKCPKCGGTAGFGYNLLLKTNRSGSWGKNDDEEVDVARVYDVATVTCMDCGKRIKWNVAHGIIQESFQDAVRNDPDMTAEQKEYWLSQSFPAQRDGVVRIKNIGGGTFVDADDPRPAAK